MAGKSHPPLFDLLQRSRPEPSRPVVVPTHEPSAPPSAAETGVRADALDPARVGPRPATDRPAPRPASSWGEVRLPRAWAFAMAAGVIALLIAVWSLGVRFGEARAEGQYAARLAAPRLTPVEPLPTEGSADTPPPSIPGGAPAGPSGSRASTAPSAPSSSGIFTASGRLASDPRIPEHNYLKLASGVEEGQARAVLAFLAGEGVEAIAVPAERATLDRGARGANNPIRVDLYSLMGVPSERFRASSNDRRRHQDRLRALGRAWLQTPEGRINFDQTVWTKYRP